MNPDIFTHYCSYKRPPGPLNIWKDIEQLSTEKPVKVSIQEIPEDRYDDVIAHMMKDFIKEEALFVGFGVKENPEAAEEIQMLWKEVLKCGWSVAAFIENPEKDGKPIIISANILYVSTLETRVGSENIYKSFRTKRISEIIKILEKLACDAELKTIDCGDDKYLTALGLSVDSSYRGMKLSGHMFAARDLICRKYGFVATGNVFTSPAAVIMAERQGYECVAEKMMRRIKCDESVFSIEKCKCEKLVFMRKKF